MSSKDRLPKYCYARGNKIWVSLKHEDGKWKNTPTPYTLEQVDEARRYVNAALRRIEAKTASGDLGELTVKAYGERWINDRKNRDISSWKDEKRRLTKYVYPFVGHLRLEDLRTRQVRDLVRALVALRKKDDKGNDTDQKLLAPRTVHHVYQTLHNLYESAVADEYVSINPVKVEKHELPKKVDKDPEWRARATYTTAEVEKLISDPAVPVERRVMYALKALAGLRHGESAAVCWRHIDDSQEPLARLNIVQAWDSRENCLKSTKTEETRAIPIHPALAATLKAWRDNHWERVYGRKPNEDDFIVPTRTFRCIAAKDAGDAMKRDLDVLGLRVKAGKTRARGGHDLRSWYETRTIEDGADSLMIRRTTHASPKDVNGNYERFSWGTICREVGKLNVKLPDGEVLKVLTDSLQLDARSSARWVKSVTPKGLEPLGWVISDGYDGSKSLQSKESLRADAAAKDQAVSAVRRFNSLLAELDQALADNDVPRASMLSKQIQFRKREVLSLNR